MKETPFKRLILNVNTLNFNCDPKDKAEYKRAFCRMLEKLDKYFIKNKLYDVVNYDAIVDEFLSQGKYTLFIDNDKSQVQNWAGVHIRKGQSRFIGLNQQYFKKGTQTEGVLCHEFIHALTLGPSVLIYKKDGDTYETQLPTRAGNLKISGFRRNVTQRKVDGLDAGDALDGGFICEALTELTKQEVYSKEECYYSYIPQTSLIKFLNELTGTKVNIQNFLRGDLPNYVQKLGRRNFEEFNSYCEKFQAKFNEDANIDYMHDSDYLMAQDIICKTILANIIENPEKYTVEEFLKIATTILTKLPTLSANSTLAEKYRADIYSARNAISRSQQLSPQQRQQFNILLNKTLLRNLKLNQTVFVVPDNKMFSIEKTPNGFVITHNGLVLANEGILPKHYSSAVVLKSPNGKFKIELDKNGIYTLTNLDIQNQTFKFGFKDKQRSSLFVYNNSNEQILEIGSAHNKQDERIVDTNINLLNNFNLSNSLQRIVADNSDAYNVKLVTNENGEQYVIVTSRSNSTFYKVLPDGLTGIELIKKESVAEGTKVCERAYLGAGQTGAIAYLTKDKTEDGDQIFTLEDGTIFIKYFVSGKEEAYAQQIKPFNTEETLFITCENTNVYNKSNKDIFETLIKADNRTC